MKEKSFAVLQPRKRFLDMLNFHQALFIDRSCTCATLRHTCLFVFILLAGVNVQGMDNLPDSLFLGGNDPRTVDALKANIPSLSRPEVQAYVMRSVFSGRGRGVMENKNTGGRGGGSSDKRCIFCDTVLTGSAMAVYNVFLCMGCSYILSM